MEDFDIESINSAWNNVKAYIIEWSASFSAGLGMSSFINKEDQIIWSKPSQGSIYGLDLVQGELPNLAYIIEVC